MDDAPTIERCRDGDAGAFRHLVERYQGQAVAHALAIVGQREDALDAVQEAFLDAFRALDGFDVSRRFYPWFYVLLRHRCFKLLRRRAPVAQPALLAALTAPPGPDRERDHGTLEALATLPAEDRELLLLKHVDGLSCRQLAERLAIPEGTVMSRLFKARARLREQLTKGDR